MFCFLAVINYIVYIVLNCCCVIHELCTITNYRLRIATKLHIYSTCVLPVLIYGSETWTGGPLYKPVGKDWIPSMYVANDASCTSAGTTSCPTTKFYNVPACSTSHTSSVNEDWALWSCRQTSKRCSGKLDPPNLCQDKGR